jgi:hypothetical protein
MQFKACDLNYELQCSHEVGPCAEKVIFPFGSSRLGDFRLALQFEGIQPDQPLYSRTEIDGLNSVHEIVRQVRLWTDREVVVDLPVLSGNAISVAIACLLVGTLSNANGLLLHSSMLVRNEKAYLFLGRSGAGKSTVAANAHGFVCVHDDNAAVRCIDGVWMGYGVPTLDNAGLPGQNVSAPIHGIYTLSKSKNLKKTPVDKVKLLQEISKHIILPVANVHTRQKIADIMLAFVSGVGCWNLEFGRHSDVGQIL